MHDFGWMNQVNIPLTLFYLLLSLQRLHQYRKELTNTCSDAGLYQLQWLRQFIYIVLAILGITALGFYGRKWNIPLIGHIYHYNYAAIVLVLYWMAYKSITQPALFSLEGRQKTRGRGVILEKESGDRNGTCRSCDDPHRSGGRRPG